MHFRFSARDIVRPGATMRWREVIGRTVLRIDFALLDGRPFHSEVSALAMPGLRVAFAEKSGLRMDRTRALTADGYDDLSLHICTGGTWIVSYRGREKALELHEAVLVSAAEVASVTCPSFSRCTCVQLPYRALAPLVPDLDDALMRLIPSDNEALRLLIGYLDTLQATGVLRTSELSPLVATHVRDLVAVALGAAGRATDLVGTAALRAARLNAIKTDIYDRLADPGLSVGSVAARQQVSPRYVQALFEAEGTTFSEYVLRLRLARVHRVLTDACSMESTISDIAFATGFGDLSHFNRAFRRRYGITPSDLRATARARPHAGFADPRAGQAALIQTASAPWD
jgi:AraC-like DNA-binding protein